MELFSIVRSPIKSKFSGMEVSRVDLDHTSEVQLQFWLLQERLLLGIQEVQHPVYGSLVQVALLQVYV